MEIEKGARVLFYCYFDLYTHTDDPVLFDQECEELGFTPLKDIKGTPANVGSRGSKYGFYLGSDEYADEEEKHQWKTQMLISHAIYLANGEFQTPNAKQKRVRLSYRYRDLAHLSVEALSHSQIQELPWEQEEDNKGNEWQAVVDEPGLCLVILRNADGKGRMVPYPIPLGAVRVYV